MTAESAAALGGRYVMSGLLGQGGMAEVYLARDLRLDRPVAVKVLRPELAGDAACRARFRREALSVAALNHPGIVAVHDTGDEPLPFLVQEYVDGLTLAQLLAEEGPAEPDRALALVGPVLDALAFAHAAGIVHRDIKPANVMLTRRGAVKVMDFGIARSVGLPGGTLTAQAMVIGTPEYLSPEQARGERVDARTDLYSVGCLLYALLTGRPPFQGPNPVAVALAHVEEQPLPPSAHAPAVPRSCDALVLRALTKDRDSRFQTAAEMRAALDGVRRSLTPPAMPAAHPPAAPASFAPAAPASGGGVLGSAVGGADAFSGHAPGEVRPGGTNSGTRSLPAPAATVVATASPWPATRPATALATAAPFAAAPTAPAVPANPATPATGPRRRPVLTAVLGAVALVAGGVVAYRVAERTAAPAAVQAPDLVGATVADARRTADRDGLRLTTTGLGTCPPPASLARAVCTQSPAPGTTVHRGTPITIHVSRLGPGPTH